MNRKQDQPTTPQGNSSESTYAPTVKQGMDWEQPDFEEFDLCMEVTAYINHWQ